MGITQFKNTATLKLDESNPVAVPLRTPVAVASTTSVERFPRKAPQSGSTWSPCLLMLRMKRPVMPS
ncbi:hypothetical protein J2W17_000828 [Pseudomonas lini]|nr:hypothetical protein [Pseudomonas lini]